MAKAKYISEIKTIIAGTEAYQSYVEALLETIADTRVGWQMLLYFGTQAPSKVVKAPHEDAALVILQYGLKRKHGVDKNPPICTSSCIDWDTRLPTAPSGIDRKTALKIPLIRLPNEGWKMKPPGKYAIKDGVLLGHKDFKKGSTVDVVLFHELCHAYLIAAGISQRWEARTTEFEVRAPLTCEKLKVYTAVEEQIVSGLGQGIGLDCCENAYRMERKLPLRTSYLDVGIPEDPKLAGVAADETWKAGQVRLKERAKTTGSKIGAVVHENRFRGDIGLFRDAKEATEQPMDLSALKPSKLESSSSSLKLDPDTAPESGDISLSE